MTHCLYEIASGKSVAVDIICIWRRPMTVYMFIDSQCPLCVAEVQMLQRHDKHKQLVFEDIHAPDFNDRYPQFNVHECYNTLHAIDDNGTVVKGLDATVLVWRTVDKYKWLGVLRWPVIKMMCRFWVSNVCATSWFFLTLIPRYC